MRKKKTMNIDSNCLLRIIANMSVIISLLILICRDELEGKRCNQLSIILMHCITVNNSEQVTCYSYTFVIPGLLLHNTYPLSLLIPTKHNTIHKYLQKLYFLHQLFFLLLNPLYLVVHLSNERFKVLTTHPQSSAEHTPCSSQYLPSIASKCQVVPLR